MNYLYVFKSFIWNHRWSLRYKTFLVKMLLIFSKLKLIVCEKKKEITKIKAIIGTPHAKK